MPNPQIGHWHNEPCGNEVDPPTKKMERKAYWHTKGVYGQSKELGHKSLPKTYMKVTLKEVNCCQKNGKGKRSEVNRRVSRENTKKGSQKLLRHPLTLEYLFL